MFSKKKYDLIFSLGEACSCSSALRRSFLQTASYPFDWLYGTDYIGRCNILANKFEKFIEKEDLVMIGEERGINCYAYHNEYNDITFNHDFSKSIPFEEAYVEVKEKYNRRNTRLLNNLEKAEKVLIVYAEIPFTNHIEVSDSTIIEGYNILKEVFGEKIDLLYIKQTKNKRTIQMLNDNITKISCDYKDDKSNLDWMAKTDLLSKNFKNIQLNMPISYKLKRNVIKLLVCAIPSRNLRTTLRKKYHV